MATAVDILTSIATQIPDVDSNGAPAYNAVSKATLLKWINDAGRLIAVDAPVVKDWLGIQSVTGQDVYALGSIVTDILKGWYDLKPLRMTAEGDNIFITKISGPSWFFGPHAQLGTGQYWQVWPCPSRTGATTTLTNAIDTTTTVLPITDSTDFMAFGFLQIDDELMRYASLPTAGTPGNITNVLRAQGGTLAASHSMGATVTECNIMFQVTRLPRPLVADTDPVEIPQALWPLIELYVLSKVRETEQNHEISQAGMQQFISIVERLANKAQLNKPRQGLQVKTSAVGLQGLFNGRLYIP